MTEIYLPIFVALYLNTGLPPPVCLSFPIQVLQSALVHNSLSKVHFRSHSVFKYTGDYIAHLVIHDGIYSVRHLMNGWDLNIHLFLHLFYREEQKKLQDRLNTSRDTLLDVCDEGEDLDQSVGDLQQSMTNLQR